MYGLDRWIQSYSYMNIIASSRSVNMTVQMYATILHVCSGIGWFLQWCSIHDHSCKTSQQSLRLTVKTCSITQTPPTSPAPSQFRDIAGASGSQRSSSWALHLWRHRHSVEALASRPMLDHRMQARMTSVNRWKSAFRQNTIHDKKTRSFSNQLLVF